MNNNNRIIVGPFSSGLQKNVEPFYIDNDSFPVLLNAYQWRGRIKRKRGTSLLGRLQRYFQSNRLAYSSVATVTLDGFGQANLRTAFGLETNATIKPATAVFESATQTYRDLFPGGQLVPTDGGLNTLDYSTTIVTIPAEAGNAVTAQFIYFPNLPVMGLEDFNVSFKSNTGTLAFDTIYSYSINTTSPYNITDISFYKNLATGTYTGYIQKTIWTRTVWAGEDYQQFYTLNFQGALWATNGVSVPFDPSTSGMQFKEIVTSTVQTPTQSLLQITNHGLERGDFIFVNEHVTATELNFQTGYVVAVLNANTVRVEFPNATIVNNGTGGIAQYLTRQSDPTKDCIKWYDGDPTDANPNPPTFLTGKGWVNFMPPLSRDPFSIADLPEAIYYLVGSKTMQIFKDRLIFIGPVIQTSDVNATAIYLEDTIVFSQNGTVYYTSSFTGNPSLPTTEFFPILVPVNQTATPSAWWEDIIGFGGYIEAGVETPLLTATNNEDVLILGCETTQMRLVYTGNDILPFNFYLIDSDLATSSTFSAINMGSSTLTRGFKGIISTNQRSAQRVDLAIPDQAFQVSSDLNGDERFTAQRDYLNEWIFFTYRPNDKNHVFPSQTLFYNYKDESWAIFNESYTSYGQFRKTTGYTWATIGSVYGTWAAWNVPWDSGNTTVFTPDIIAGNQQGFVMLRDEGTNEGTSLYVQSFYGDGFEQTAVNSPNHGLNLGDYIVFYDSRGRPVPGIYQVTDLQNVPGPPASPSSKYTNDSFAIIPSLIISQIPGGFTIQRMYNPFIQTKQFPTMWGLGRKTRLGIQKYLLTKTDSGQITLQIFLSQDTTTNYNQIPNNGRTGLVSSSIINTCTEYDRRPFALNVTTSKSLLMNIYRDERFIGKSEQSQLWHRVSNSLVGDTVQLGFTMSDSQMTDTLFRNQFAEIELHGFILEVYPSQLLC